MQADETLSMLLGVVGLYLSEDQLTDASHSHLVCFEHCVDAVVRMSCTCLFGRIYNTMHGSENIELFREFPTRQPKDGNVMAATLQPLDLEQSDFCQIRGMSSEPEEKRRERSSVLAHGVLAWRDKV